MNKIYVTSDTHFGHDKDFIYGPRGYASEEAASCGIVENINSLVGKDDELYILGDIVLGNNKAKEYINAIKCRNIHIIAGNHDTDYKIEDYKKIKNVVEICQAKLIEAESWKWFLCHYPVYTNNFNSDRYSHDAVWSLCGHCHTNDRFLELKKGLMSYHCELDAHNNMPISIADIKKDIVSFLGENK